MKLLLIALWVLLPSMGWAAYLNPEIEQNALQPNGMVKLTLVFRGDAGEPDVRRELLVRPGMTFQQGRYFVDDTIRELDAARTASNVPQLQPGQTITRLVRPAAVPTAKQAWRTKFNAYMAAKDAGLTNATMATDLAALKADLEATYQTGFLNE
jgi:hypothetical protein